MCIYVHCSGFSWLTQCKIGHQNLLPRKHLECALPRRLNTTAGRLNEFCLLSDLSEEKRKPTWRLVHEVRSRCDRVLETGSHSKKVFELPRVLCCNYSSILLELMPPALPFAKRCRLAIIQNITQKSSEHRWDAIHCVSVACINVS